MVEEPEVEALLAGHVREHLVDLSLPLVPADRALLPLPRAGGTRTLSRMKGGIVVRMYTHVRSGV